MSRALDLLLDSQRLADCAANDRALTTADRALLSADSKMTRFRVEADWNGGGFGYTIPAASAEDAYLWGEHKARFHRDAEITVAVAYPCQAGPVVSDADRALAAQFAGPADLTLDLDAIRCAGL